MPELQQVIIEFQSDTTGLQPAEDRLESLGKIDKQSAGIFKSTNAELQKRSKVLADIAAGTAQVTLSATKEQQVYNKLVTSLKSLSGESKKAVQTLLQMPTEQVAAGFDNAAISVDDYLATLEQLGNKNDEVEASSGSLRQQLKQLTGELAKLKLAGLDNSEAYEKLRQKAGQLKDALGDVNNEIKDAGSDTQGIDNLLGSMSALAGGFAAVQGASALFGDENKELQETLVRVTASMAILQGAQQFLNAVQKEGAISLTVLNIQQKISNAQTALEAALQSESAIARGLATVAQRALNLAMSANPIGVIITALAVVIPLLLNFASNTRKAASSQADLNQQIRNATEGLQASSDGLKRFNDKRISDLQKAGARQSDINKQNLNTEIELQHQRVDQINALQNTIEQYRRSTDKETIELLGKAEDQLYKLQQDNQDALVEIYKQTNETRRQLQEEALQDAVAANKTALLVTAEGSKAQLAQQKALIQAQANLDKNAAGLSDIQRREIQVQADKDKLAAQVEFNKRVLDLQKKNLETQLIGVEAGTQEEFALRLRLQEVETKSELQNVKLSAKEKLAIEKEGFQKRLKLQKDFNVLVRQQTIQAEIDRNTAALAQREIDNSDALALTIENITLSAQLEIDAAKDNAAKIKEVIATRDKEIRAARLANIQTELEFELRSQAAVTGVEVRANADRQRRVKEAFDKRKISAIDYTNALFKLIDDQTAHDVSAVTLRIAALNQEFKDKLISQKDYNRQYAELIDQEAAIVEEGERKKRDAVAATADENKKRQVENAKIYIEIASQIIDVFASLNASAKQNEDARTEAARKQTDELLKSGAITEKEAAKRNARIDKEERFNKRRQAEREKRIAVFEAFLAIPKAYLTGLTQGGPILGAIYAAIAAVQAGIVAARKVPEFYRGKKDSYEGPGKVGDRGAELIEKDGQMYVAKKPQIVWLGKQDKVYTATETKKMLAGRPVMRKGIPVIVNEKPSMTIDYERLGKEVGKNSNTTVFIDGVKALAIEDNSFTKYLNNRRSF